MDRAAFHYDLPRELIAQAPLPERSASRLLVLDGRSGAIEDRRFVDLAVLLAPGDLLVVNDTRVVPARLRGEKASGGRIELLLERVTGCESGRFQIKASHAPKPGSELRLAGGASARVVGRAGDLYELAFDRELKPYLGTHSEIPLPPYIARAPESGDTVRYQTVFAAQPGAVAAPTAGLHFDAPLLAALERGRVHVEVADAHVGGRASPP